MEPKPLRHYVEGEYAPLDMPAGWHVVSLLCFAAALGSRFVVLVLLPARWPSSWMRPLLPGLAGLIARVPWLPVTFLVRADELCIGQHVALNCSLDLQFRRAS
ncbi:MAG TPA: hypothetical protein VLV54_07995 [Thermoanaerobaculia bacterium]|nr:hypothetical protein [Thermoanaerobaculia bacterium]